MWTDVIGILGMLWYLGFGWYGVEWYRKEPSRMVIVTCVVLWALSITMSLLTNEWIEFFFVGSAIIWIRHKAKTA